MQLQHWYSSRKGEGSLWAENILFRAFWTWEPSLCCNGPFEISTDRHFCYQIRSVCVNAGDCHTWGSRGGSDALCRGGAAVQAPRPVTFCHQEPVSQGVPLGTHCRGTAG